MSHRPRFGREYIRREFEHLSTELRTDVRTYLIGGGAMAFRNLKDATKDVDLVVRSPGECRRLLGVLDQLHYERLTDPGTEYDRLGARHCVENDDGCRIDLFDRQVANKLYFSDGMADRSLVLLKTRHLRVGLAAPEDVFLFKSVAERPEDVDDMATLVRTGLDFDVVESEIAAQVRLLGGERFTTVVSESLEKLDERHGIQTPLDPVVDEYYGRYMRGLALRMALDEDTPRPIAELASELGLEEREIEARAAYLERFGLAERVAGGVLDTGRRDRFT